MHQIYDCLLKNIFDTYPQGVLDIINDVIVEKYPELIYDFYPKEFWETFPQELLDGCPNDLIKSDIFRFNFKDTIENEVFTIGGRNFVLDRPFGTMEDLLFGLEFQSSKLNYYRKLDFYEYQSNLHDKYKKQVRIVVFSTARANHKLIRHKVGPDEWFTILIISLKALNQKQTINNSLNKISNNKNMSDKEKALFLSSPLMDKKNTVKAINVLMENFYKIKNLTNEEYEDMQKIILIYSNQWCKKCEIEKGGTDMVKLPPETQKIYDSLIEQGIGRAITAVKMINNGSSLEDTSKATGLTVSEINQLCTSK